MNTIDQKELFEMYDLFLLAAATVVFVGVMMAIERHGLKIYDVAISIINEAQKIEKK